MPSPSTTPTLDLPQSIKNVFDFAFQNNIPGGMNMSQPRAGLQDMQPGTPDMQDGIPGYAEGGLVQPGGDAGVPPINTGIGGGPGLATGEAQGAAPQGNIDIEKQAKQLVKQQPQMVREILQNIQDQIEMGETSEQEITRAGKLAIIAARNPDMYPKIVEKLQAEGVDDVPPQFDPEFILTLVLVYLVWQQKGSVDMGSNTEDDGVPNFAMGGLVTHGSKGKTGPVVGKGGPKEDMVRADLSNGEFVMTAEAAQYFGTDKLHKMNQLAAEKVKLQNGAKPWDLA